VRPAPSAGVSAEALTRRIDEFLGSRGFQGGSAPDRPEPPGQTAANQTALDFVCEDDVRKAIHAGKTLVVSERAIVTPAARDLAEAHRVFTVAPWRG
jgi:hypothetical protein